MARELPKVYEPQQVETEIYKMWEEGGYFKKSAPGRPFAWDHCALTPKRALSERIRERNLPINAINTDKLTHFLPSVNSKTGI